MYTQTHHQLQVRHIYTKETAFTRRREARSRVPAAVQLQPSMVGSVRDLGSDTERAVKRSAACCHIQCWCELQPCFSASISSAHISWPRSGWVGWGGLRESPPWAGEQPIPLLLNRRAAQQSQGIWGKCNRQRQRERKRRVKGGGEGGGERQNGTAEGNSLPSASRPPGALPHHLPRAVWAYC